MRSKSVRLLQHCVIAVFLVAFPGAWILTAAMSRPAPGRVDFRRDVQPILKQYCIECHGPSQQMHAFRLDRRRDAIRGGTAVMIVPGSSTSSRIYLKLLSNKYGPQMPMTGALDQEQIDIIKEWIDQGAEWPDELSGETSSSPADPRATQVMAALRDGDKSAFAKLVNENPKVANLRGPAGTTPLMQAVLYGDLESVKVLLASGADPNVRNEANATALMWAVDDIEKTRLLLDHGADVNARSDDSRTPLLIAAGPFGSNEVVKLLLDRGADTSAKSPTNRGYTTPLSEAARTGDVARLRMLIDRGADVKAAGFPPLMNAYIANCAQCLDILMEKADKETLTRTAVILAPPLGDARAVKMLLDKGARANASDPKGNTLLMLAASSDKIPVESVDALIEHGADLNTKNPEGKTALDFAKLRGATPLVDRLVKAGAKEGTPLTITVPDPKPAASVRAAVERSIPLLQKTDAIFTQKTNCISCHHNTLTAMTVTVAQKNGFSVDEQVGRSQVKKIAAGLEIWRERVLQGVGIPGEPNSVSYMMVGLAAANYPSDAATDAMARLVLTRQLPDGRWESSEHRPPIESTGDISITAIALRSIQVYGPKAQHAKYEASVKRAADWLMTAKSETIDERAFQLLGLGWAGVKPNDAVIKNAVRALLKEQRADGGWAQLPTLTSDAYATGQALVALRQAGNIAMTDPAYKRGIEFLMKTQREDGSWYVRSRSIPLQPYFESGFPYGPDQWISTAATNWATMALALR
jgi:ankyrin repeat protein